MMTMTLVTVATEVIIPYESSIKKEYQVNPRVLRRNSQPNDAITYLFLQTPRIFCINIAHASTARSKPKVELDSYAETCVVGHKCIYE